MQPRSRHLLLSAVVTPRRELVRLPLRCCSRSHNAVTSKIRIEARAGVAINSNAAAMSADALTAAGTCMFDDAVMAAKLPAAVVQRFNECLITGAPTTEALAFPRAVQY